MKRLISLVLVVVLCLGMIPAVTANQTGDSQSVKPALYLNYEDGVLSNPATVLTEFDWGNKYGIYYGSSTSPVVTYYYTDDDSLEQEGRLTVKQLGEPDANGYRVYELRLEDPNGFLMYGLNNLILVYMPETAEEGLFYDDQKLQSTDGVYELICEGDRPVFAWYHTTDELEDADLTVPEDTSGVHLEGPYQTSRGSVLAIVRDLRIVEDGTTAAQTASVALKFKNEDKNKTLQLAYYQTKQQGYYLDLEDEPLESVRLFNYWCYVVEYTPGEENNLYFVTTKTINNVSAENLEYEISESNRQTVVTLSVPETASGVIHTDVDYETDEGDLRWGMVFVPEGAEPGLYATLAMDKQATLKDGVYTVTIPADTLASRNPTAKMIYVHDERIETMSDNMTKLTDTVAMIQVDDFENELSMTVNGTTTKLQVAFEGAQASKNTVALLPDALDEDYNSQYGMQIFENYGPASFKYKTENGNETFYIGPAMGYDGFGADHYGSAEPVITEKQVEDNAVLEKWWTSVGIWTLEKTGYQLVEEPLRSEIIDAFGGTIQLNLYGQFQKGEFPEVVAKGENMPMNMTLNMRYNNANGWYFVVTGTINDQDLTAVSYKEFNPLLVIEKKIEATQDQNPIEVANGYLAQLVKDKAIRDGAYKLIFPAEIIDSEGVDLVIPKEFGVVRVCGSYASEEERADGKPRRTVIQGGVKSDNYDTYLEDIDFVGTGKKANFNTAPGQVDEVVTSSDNIGFYGTSIGKFDNCSFTDFDVAVVCTEGLRWGSDMVYFYNNNVGLYINRTLENGGKTNLFGTMFENNDVAIMMRNIQEFHALKLYNYTMNRCSFVNNEKDIVNTMKKWYFAGSNYFAKDNFQVRAANSMTVGSSAAVLEGYVSIYPAALNSNFNEFEFGADGVLSDDLTYEIPVSEIVDQEFVVVKNHTPIVGFTFDTEQDAAPEQLVPVMLSAMSRDGESEVSVFDPKVTLEKETDKITLTMNDLPKSAKVFLPCTWTDVTVLEGETEIDAKADGVTVSFTATKGGSYTITKNEDQTPDPEEPVVPDEPAVPDEPSVPVRPGRPSGSTGTDKPQQPSRADFSDVAENAWYSDAVQYVYEKGLMNGMGGGQFGPDATTNRAMVITMLARLAGETTDGGALWYEKAVQWAIANGISDGTDPNGLITRQQIVTMLWRYAGSPEPAGKLEGYTDQNKIADYAVKAMIWAVEQKIIRGVGDGLLDPAGTATRAQIATMFMNYLER